MSWLSDLQGYADDFTTGAGGIVNKIGDIYSKNQDFLTKINVINEPRTQPEIIAEQSGTSLFSGLTNSKLLTSKNIGIFALLGVGAYLLFKG